MERRVQSCGIWPRVDWSFVIDFWRALLFPFSWRSKNPGSGGSKLLLHVGNKWALNTGSYVRRLIFIRKAVQPSSHNRSGTSGVMFCYHSRSGGVNFRTSASASTFQCWFVQSHIFSRLLQRYVTAVVQKASSQNSRTVEARKDIILTLKCNCGFCLMKFARFRYGKCGIFLQFWILTLDSHREFLTFNWRLLICHWGTVDRCYAEVGGKAGE